MRLGERRTGIPDSSLAWAIQQSPNVTEVHVAPGNGGTVALAKNVSIEALDIDALVTLAGQLDIDLTVVGPEAPLVAGIVDRFTAAGQIGRASCRERV